MSVLLKGGRVITATDDVVADVHEFLLTARGTALFSAVRRVFADLTPYGGVAHGSYMDQAIQEIPGEVQTVLAAHWQSA